METRSKLQNEAETPRDPTLPAGVRNKIPSVVFLLEKDTILQTRGALPLRNLGNC